MSNAPNDFTHLHVHSEFNVLDGGLGIALASASRGITPIPAVETFIPSRSAALERPTQPFHVIPLAGRRGGCENVCALRDAQRDGYYYKLRIDREHLVKDHDA